MLKIVERMITKMNAKSNRNALLSFSDFSDASHIRLVKPLNPSCFV